MSEPQHEWQRIIDEEGLPRALETEKTVLGSILLRNDLVESANTRLEAGDFYLEAHRHIWHSMISLAHQQMSIDLITLGADLETRKLLEQVGGRTYISSLIDGVPSTDNIEPYVRIIKRKRRERDCFKQLNGTLDRLADDADLDNLLADLKLYCEKASEEDAEAFTGVYTSLFDLFNADLKEAEQLFLGVRRGEVAAFEAVTNYGKTTFLMNLGLSLAAGETCIPLSPDSVKPRRILFIDCESPASMLRSDLRQMLRQIRDAETACQNFIVVVDGMIRGEPLCLSRRDHFEQVIRWAKMLQVDVIIIDTVTSAFEIQDENANAEITRRVMNPLKRLAREANCGVIFTHHIGKSGETQSVEGAYKGRGASAFGGLSRTVFTLEKDTSKGPGYVVLSCRKSKGVVIEPTLLKLNPETRWFEVCMAKPTEKPGPPTAQELADFIEECGEVRSEDIKKHFAVRGVAHTISDRIKDAERLGLIYKKNQKAPWRLCKSEKGSSNPSLQIPENSPDEAFVQSADPIGDAQMHKYKSNNHTQSQIAYCPCGASGVRFAFCDRCGEVLR